MVSPIGQLIIQYEGQTQTFPLNMQVLSIGREPASGLCLSEPSVSRRHAGLRMEPQGPMLTDLGSSLGTFIGNERLRPNQPYPLADGTTFRIGPYQLTYQVLKTAAHPLEPANVSQPVKELPTILPASVQASSPILEQTPQSTTYICWRPQSDLDSMYRQYLPDIFQENDFLNRFLRIFEDIWEPLEQRQDYIALYFDPRTCPASFLSWLASWLHFPLNGRWPEARKRRLLSHAMELYDSRGTGNGLAGMIEVCTGLQAEIFDSPSQPFVFHIRITLPPGSSSETVDKGLIEELIQAHKPAHAGYILEINT